MNITSIRIKQNNFNNRKPGLGTHKNDEKENQYTPQLHFGYKPKTEQSIIRSSRKVSAAVDKYCKESGFRIIGKTTVENKLSHIPEPVFIALKGDLVMPTRYGEVVEDSIINLLKPDGDVVGFSDIRLEDDSVYAAHVRNMKEKEYSRVGPTIYRIICALSSRCSRDGNISIISFNTNKKAHNMNMNFGFVHYKNAPHDEFYLPKSRRDELLQEIRQNPILFDDAVI